MLHDFPKRPAATKTLILPAVCALILSRPALAPAQAPAVPPNANPPTQPKDSTEKSDPASDKAKFIEALDIIESQISEQERYGEYGHPELKRYVQDLETEYFANGDALEKLSGSETSGEALSRQSLEARQQHISLLLWQLKRTGSQFGQPGFDSRALTTRVHKLLSEHRSVMRDVNLMKRFQSVTRRLSDLSRMKITSSQLHYNFHFVRPSRPASDRGVFPAPPSKVAPREFPVGPIQTLREPIRNLVGLSWADGFLSWDETHWESPFAGFDLKNIQQQIDAELKKRKVELPAEDRMVAQRNQRLYDTPRPVLLFQDLQHVAAQGKPPSRSYSSSGSYARSRFTAGEIEAAIAISPQRMEFSVREDSGPSRTLLIRRGTKNSLRISLIGQHILLLEQYADGSVRWVSIGDQVVAEKASSLAQLYARHPEKIENELFARLRHCGVQTPMSRYDSKLIERVLDQIQGVDRPTQQQFDRLVTQIDSGNFSERQKAYRELSKNVETYSILLLKTSDDDGRSAEASARLAELRKKSGEQFGELDRLIEKTGWLNDPRYLIGLSQHVDDVQTALIAQRLESITGQSFGNDWTRWQSWSQSR